MKASGHRIKEARQRRGWHQADLAAAAGLSRPYIAQVELGTREPSWVAIEAIAKALKLDPDLLVRSEVTCPHCGHGFDI